MLNTPVHPNVALDAIEAAMEQSHGRSGSIGPIVPKKVSEEELRLRKFTSWKIELGKIMNADRRLKPDSYARVGRAILDHVNQYSFDAFPSEATIADEAAVGQTTVKKAIVRLAELGYFEVGKRKRVNRYLFRRYSLKPVAVNRLTTNKAKRVTTNTFIKHPDKL